MRGPAVLFTATVEEYVAAIPAESLRAGHDALRLSAS